jgi:hypothetical protein
MDLEEAVPRFFEGCNRNTFLAEMPTGTPERLHRYVVADHLSERLLASRLVVESHCAPEVDRHFGRVVNALVEFRDNTGALMVDRGGGGNRMALIEDWRREILEHVDALRPLARA